MRLSWLGTEAAQLTICTSTAGHQLVQEADAAAAADPRGLGGLRADKIKSLSMTAPRDDQGGAAGGGGSEGGGAAGWLQELVIDGGWLGRCQLVMWNCYLINRSGEMKGYW